MPSVTSVRCPTCGASYRVPAEHAGKIARCKHCSTKIRVPALGDLPTSTVDSKPPVPVPPPPASLSRLSTPSQAARHQETAPPVAGKRPGAEIQHARPVLSQGSRPETRPIPSPPAEPSTLKPNDGSPDESPPAAARPWWKRNAKDLIPLPVALGVIGLGLMISVSKSGSAINPTTKRIAGFVVVCLTIRFIYRGIVRADQRFSPLMKVLVGSLILVLIAGIAVTLAYCLG